MSRAQNQTQHWLQIAKDILDQPTAACKEDCPLALVRQFVGERPALSLSADAAGNLLVKYGNSPAPLVLVAHLDHPGFWIERVARTHVELSFQGGVGAGHVQAGQRVAFFSRGQADPTGYGELIRVQEKKARLVKARASIVSGNAHAHGFAMWNFPGFHIEDGVIHSRGCDDLLGAAATLCVLDEIARRKPKNVALWALFTRAEEIGFFGALEALRLKTLPKSACVLSLECSKADGIAQQGEGVIVRVGDRTSVFDPGLSAALQEAATRVKKRLRDFKSQRKLMDGGTCEATVFCAAGYRASGLAMPLGNYHNQAVTRGQKTIGAENVRVEDFVRTIQLLVELALHPDWLATNPKPPKWLEERARAARKALSSSRPHAAKHESEM